jgi:sulfatase modifying factor 1
VTLGKKQESFLMNPLSLATTAIFLIGSVLSHAETNSLSKATVQDTPISADSTVSVQSKNQSAFPASLNHVVQKPHVKSESSRVSGTNTVGGRNEPISAGGQGNSHQDLSEEQPSFFLFVRGGVLTAEGDGELKVPSFIISKYETTYSQWLGVSTQRLSYGYAFDNDGAGAGVNHPVVNVSWYDCIKWCNLLSEIEGLCPVYLADGAVYKQGRVDSITINKDAHGYRLPTEAEWEFAARGGMASKGFLYSGSDDLDAVGWYSGNSDGRGTRPVGLKLSNELGIFDMSGNAWEWCFDWHPEHVGLLRVRRGGTWQHIAAYCRVALRYENGPKFGSPTIGFRLARWVATGRNRKVTVHQRD